MSYTHARLCVLDEKKKLWMMGRIYAPRCAATVSAISSAVQLVLAATACPRPCVTKLDFSRPFGFTFLVLC
jgi:hypothetical protein